jgi:hypothetical protein
MGPDLVRSPLLCRSSLLELFETFRRTLPGSVPEAVVRRPLAWVRSGVSGVLLRPQGHQRTPMHSRWVNPPRVNVKPGPTLRSTLWSIPSGKRMGERTGTRRVQATDPRPARRGPDRWRPRRSVLSVGQRSSRHARMMSMCATVWCAPPASLRMSGVPRAEWRGGGTSASGATGSAPAAPVESDSRGPVQDLWPWEAHPRGGCAGAYGGPEAIGFRP